MAFKRQTLRKAVTLHNVGEPRPVGCKPEEDERADSPEPEGFLQLAAFGLAPDRPAVLLAVSLEDPDCCSPALCSLLEQMRSLSLYRLKSLA